MRPARVVLMLALAAVTGVAACGPVPVAQAERSCVGDARAARGPQGEIAMGVVSDGHRIRPTTGVKLSISSDYVMGRDPSDVFTNCVMRRSGQVPTRPLHDQPGWRG